MKIPDSRAFNRSGGGERIARRGFGERDGERENCIALASNLRKHRVSFEGARRVFVDPLSFDEPDDDPDEER